MRHSYPMYQCHYATSVYICTYRVDHASSCRATSLAQAQSDLTALKRPSIVGLDQSLCYRFYCITVPLFPCRRQSPLYASVYPRVLLSTKKQVIFIPIFPSNCLLRAFQPFSVASHTVCVPRSLCSLGEPGRPRILRLAPLL